MEEIISNHKKIVSKCNPGKRNSSYYRRKARYVDGEYQISRAIVKKKPKDLVKMKIVFAIVISLIFILSTVYTLIPAARDNPDQQEISRISYLPHAPISIVGNGDFTTTNGVTSGNGTIGEPFIIEGWEIDASSADGIYIRDTTSYFIIRDIFVHNGTPTFEGIILNNTENGRVENSHVMANWNGIVIFSSANVSVNDTFAQDNLNTGIGAQDSTNITFLRNNATSSGGVGFVLTNCTLSTVLGNDAYYNSFSLNIYFSSNITMTFNNLTHGTAGGCWLFQSVNISIHHNNFIDNVNYQAKDNKGSENSWDDGYPSGGNYWSDYSGIDSNSDGIGDTSYVIDSNSADSYPLMGETIIPEFSSLIVPIIVAIMICVIGRIVRQKQT